MLKIKRYNLIILVIILLLTLHCPLTVSADDTSLGRMPEGVFPMQEADIIMESEEITVDLERNHVECVFLFHNTGKDKNVLMGFPGKIIERFESGLTNEVNLEIRNFKTIVKDKELEVIHEKAVVSEEDQNSNSLIYSEYFTFNVLFKADEKITVRNTYDFSPSYDSMGNISSGYVLKTGAMWKGPIGFARVTFKLGKIQPYQLEGMQPGGYKLVGNDLVWERKDFEPNYDLWLYYNSYRYGEEFLKDAANEETTTIKEEKETYARVKELAEKSETDELLEIYNKSIAEKDYVLSLYIASLLPADKVQNEAATLGDIIIEKQEDRYYVNCDVFGTEPVQAELIIKHISDGIEVLDEHTGNNSTYVTFSPGIEYIITCKLTDWTDRTEEKSIKYKVPEVSAVSQESPAKTSIETVNEPEEEPAKSENNNSKITAWVLLSGIFVAVLLAVPVIILRKRKNI